MCIFAPIYIKKERLMTAKVIILAMLAATMLPTRSMGAPSMNVSFAEERMQQDNDMLHETHITLNGTSLHVSGAEGQTLHIYNILGVKVMSFKVDSNDKHVELPLPTGCYIVKVGKVVRKISVQR